MLQRALLRRLSRKPVEVEIARQFEAFVTAFGKAPDFVDGHQHVHQFPQVRDAFLGVVREVAPNAWVRQCGRAPRPLSQRLSDRKALLLDWLSRGFRERAAAHGIAVNPAFAGTYDFTTEPSPDFAALFPAFLDGLPAGGLIMCHPGRVDAELERLDPLTYQREREYAYLAGEEFPALLASRGFTLAETQARSEV
jgi:chitin disaccharide deacetylase